MRWVKKVLKSNNVIGCWKIFLISDNFFRPYSGGDETLSDGGFASSAGAGLDFSAGASSSGNDFQTNLAIQQQSAQLMSQMHHLNDTCWDICVTGGFSSSLSSREETCLTNCVERFVDTTLLITNRSVDNHDNEGML